MILQKRTNRWKFPARNFQWVLGFRYGPPRLAWGSRMTCPNAENARMIKSMICWNKENSRWSTYHPCPIMMLSSKPQRISKVGSACSVTNSTDLISGVGCCLHWRADQCALPLTRLEFFTTYYMYVSIWDLFPKIGVVFDQVIIQKHVPQQW